MNYGLPLKTSLLAALAMSLCGCLTMPVTPAKIDPPPKELTEACARPDPLPDGSTAQLVVGRTVEWIGAYWCATGRQQGLVEAWPK